MLWWFHQSGIFQMSLVEQTPTQDEPLSHETQSKAPAEDSMGLIAGLRDDSNRLAAARGIMIGMVLGIILWAVILWVLL
jgi:hypothetical protein